MDKTRKIIAEVIISMIENNTLNNMGHESFVGWCEDGAIFNNRLTEREAIECEQFMREIAPLVDAMTEKLDGIND